jgi:hypothetical protein
MSRWRRQQRKRARLARERVPVAVEAWRMPTREEWAIFWSGFSEGMRLFCAGLQATARALRFFREGRTETPPCP